MVCPPAEESEIYYESMDLQPLCLRGAEVFLMNKLWQYTHYVTVQPAPFVKPHFVLIAAVAAVLLIDGCSVHLTISYRIFMQA